MAFEMPVISVHRASMPTMRNAESHSWTISRKHNWSLDSQSRLLSLLSLLDNPPHRHIVPKHAKEECHSRILLSWQDHSSRTLRTRNLGNCQEYILMWALLPCLWPWHILHEYVIHGFALNEDKYLGLPLATSASLYRLASGSFWRAYGKERFVKFNLPW